MKSHFQPVRSFHHANDTSAPVPQSSTQVAQVTSTSSLHASAPYVEVRRQVSPSPQPAGVETGDAIPWGHDSTASVATIRPRSAIRQQPVPSVFKMKNLFFVTTSEQGVQTLHFGAQGSNFTGQLTDDPLHPTAKSHHTSEVKHYFFPDMAYAESFKSVLQLAATMKIPGTKMRASPPDPDVWGGSSIPASGAYLLKVRYKTYRGTPSFPATEGRVSTERHDYNDEKIAEIYYRAMEAQNNPD